MPYLSIFFSKHNPFPILTLCFYYSPVLVPGTSLMNDGFMGVVYLLWLGYLFLGIAIISDIFME